MKKYYAELTNFIYEMLILDFPYEEKRMYLIDRMDLIEREDDVCFSQNDRNKYLKILKDTYKKKIPKDVLVELIETNNK